LGLLKGPSFSASFAAKEQVPDIEDFYTLHQQACERGDTFYTDPATGLFVFTEVAHKKRGKCCGSGCRHCPFNHANVKDDQKIVPKLATV